jgi:hypothetical protein
MEALTEEGRRGELPNKVSESELIKVWQCQWLERGRLVTEDGEPIEVVYPGRINDDQGADFRDAVIATSRGLITGDVEIHVKSSDWQAHQHHRDRAYNRVILHVAMWHNSGLATTLQSGRTVPVLALHKYLKGAVSQWPESASFSEIQNTPCHQLAERLITEDIAKFIDGAGEERFRAKAALFGKDLTQIEAGQVLYQGIMGALGYSKNKLPFWELSRRLPLPALEPLARREMSEEECLAWLQARLLGMAGLLPSQRQDWPLASEPDDEWCDRLERIWASLSHPEVMSFNAWHLFKVRPVNSPVRRLAAMSYLIRRYRDKGMLDSWLGLLREAPATQGHRQLEEGFLVTARGYWASHFDFGPGRRIRNSTLLGRARGAEIMVNVLLPFAFAWGQFTGETELGEQAFTLYLAYTRLAVNSIERHMVAQLGLSHRLVDSARRQQGLIHIYNDLCIQGRCSHCALSQLKAGHHIQV